MRRRDFIRKSIYLGAGSALGSSLLSGLKWKPSYALAAAPADNSIVRIHCGSVQQWNFNPAAGNWSHDHINYPVVEDMLNHALTSLTMQSNVKNAWQDILNYQSGQTIAIKINLNSEESTLDQSAANQSYQMANAVIRSLNLYGVPFANIKIYDVSRDQNDRIRSGLNSQGFAAVDYVYRNTHYSWDDNASMYFPVEGVTRRYPDMLTQADHLISVMLMKGHKTYITGAIKNHFGTIEGNTPTSMDRSSIHPNRQHNIPLICTSTHIKDKLRLNICEAFYMTWNTEYDTYEPCLATAYFPAGISGYASPNSILVSKNPVVMDSVLHDLVMRERIARGEPNFQTDFLQNASTMGLGLYEHGIAETHDIAYSQIQYQTINMPLVTKKEVDNELRKFKQGLVDSYQVEAKVKRLEAGW